MKLKVLIAIFWLLPFLMETVKVYEFIDSNSSTSDISYITMEVNVSVKDRLAICSSHKQLQANAQSSTIYNIYEDKDYKKPWLSVGFWDLSLWVAEGNDRLWHYLGGLDKLTDFLDWINLCIKIDFSEKKLSSSINGHDAVIADTSLSTLNKVQTLFIR